MKIFGAWLKFFVNAVVASAIAGAIGTGAWVIFIGMWGSIIRNDDVLVTSPVVYVVFGCAFGAAFLWMIGNELSEGDTF